MNRDVLEGQWHLIKGKIKDQWGRLTDDELNQIEGKQEKLYGYLQKHYGYSKDEIDKKLDDLLAKRKTH